MIESLFFFFSWLAAIAFLFRLAHAGTKALWLPIVLVGGAVAAFACVSILSAFGIAYSLTENAILNCLLAVAAFFLSERGGRRKPPIALAEKHDLVALVAVTFIVIGCAFVQFGFPPGINFSTSDPANHLYASFVIAEGGEVNGQFFTHLLCACAILAFEPFIGAESTYIVFIAIELFLFWLAGLSFYSMLKFRFSPNAVVSVTLTTLFMLGYPLNNLVFGFSYLGAAVTVVTLCVIVAPMAIDGERDKAGWILLSLLLYALMITYTLFVPVVYFSLFAYLLLLRKKQGYSLKEVAKEEFGLFAFPVLMGFFLSYMPMFGNGSPSGAIATEGYIFRDLYSSFIFIAPLFVCGIYSEFKSKTYSFDLILVVFALMFAFVLLIGGVAGKVSSYYFFKCHYLLWMLLFAYTAVGINAILAKSRRLLISYALVYAFLFVACFSGADQRLSTARQLFNPSPASSSFVPFVYRFNLAEVQSSPISEGTIDLINQSRALGDAGDKVAVLGDDAVSYWFRALTLQEQDGYWWQTSLDAQKEELSNSDYVLVLDYSGSLTLGTGEAFSSIQDYAYSIGEVYYGNEYGCIIKVG